MGTSQPPLRTIGRQHGASAGHENLPQGMSPPPSSLQQKGAIVANGKGTFSEAGGCSWKRETCCSSWGDGHAEMLALATKNLNSRHRAVSHYDHSLAVPRTSQQYPYTANVPKCPEHPHTFPMRATAPGLKDARYSHLTGSQGCPPGPVTWAAAQDWSQTSVRHNTPSLQQQRLLLRCPEPQLLGGQ